MPQVKPTFTIVAILFLLIIEWIGREQQYALAKLGIALPKALRWSFYYVLIMMILFFCGTEQQFIYFQF